MALTAQCWRCRHYQGQLECEAFPRGIPGAILDGEHDHTGAYRGDHGVRYQPMVAKAHDEADEPEERD